MNSIILNDRITIDRIEIYLYKKWQVQKVVNIIQDELYEKLTSYEKWLS
jgi:hypothetical protein